MKQLSAIAGVLLLSSSLIAGCTPNASPSPSPDNRAESYDTSRGGRVIGNNTTRPGAMGADQDRLGVRDNIGPDRLGVRNSPVDRDRLGVPDNIGPDVGVRNSPVDQDRLGVRDNIGPDRGANLRNDRALEARVEALPGVRDATVLVAGNTAYVALNQGTAANTGRGTTGGPNTTTNNKGANINGINDRTGTPGGITLRNALGGRTGGQTGTVGNGQPDNRDRRGGNVAGTGGTSASGNNTSMGTNSAGTTSGAAGTPGITSPGNNYGSAGYAGTGNSTGTRGTYNNDITTPGNRTVGRINNNAGTTNNGGVITRVVPNTIGMGAVTGGALTDRQGTMGNVNNGGRAARYNTNNSTAGNNTYGNGANIMGNDNNHNVSDDVKARVTNVIRQGNPGITTVYVSANPGIVNRMDAFTRDAANGRGANAGNDLLDALRRVWPTAGTGNAAGNAGNAGNNTTNR